MAANVRWIHPVQLPLLYFHRIELFEFGILEKQRWTGLKMFNLTHRMNYV